VETTADLVRTTGGDLLA